MIDLADAKVGQRVTFYGERLSYTIQARGDRYLICTKPFAARHTYLYTIVDLKDMVRGADNKIFGRIGGYGSRDECQAAIMELEATRGRLGVSQRNRVPLDVTRLR